MSRIQLLASRGQFIDCVSLYEEIVATSAIRQMVRTVGICLVEWLLVKVSDCLMAGRKGNKEDPIWIGKGKALITLASEVGIRERLSSGAFEKLCRLDLSEI